MANLFKLAFRWYQYPIYFTPKKIDCIAFIKAYSMSVVIDIKGKVYIYFCVNFPINELKNFLYKSSHLLDINI